MPIFWTIFSKETKQRGAALRWIQWFARTFPADFPSSRRPLDFYLIFLFSRIGKDGNHICESWSGRARAGCPSQREVPTDWEVALKKSSKNLFDNNESGP